MSFVTAAIRFTCMQWRDPHLNESALQSVKRELEERDQVDVK